MKKIIILKHGGGELANQLWNYISIYAYGLEISAEVQNPSFFEYHSHFNFLKNESPLTRFFSSWFRDSTARRGSLKNRFWRNIYLILVRIMKPFSKNSWISSENEMNQVVYIPPTSSLDFLDNVKIGYFSGWLFRNPVGLAKYRKNIISAFAPSKDTEKRVEDIIQPLRKEYEKIIGIHLRQSDYRTFKGGDYFISQTRVKEIIDEFIQKNSIDKNRILFLMTSDGPIESGIFRNLNAYISKENSVTDLFLLSSTDMIIGSDSSFGAFASWYGNIPHIIMTKNPIDWTYYADKKKFFENKYGKMVNY
ncbi:MAG: hypothetical protein Q8Q03_02035 [bacterium]|nr:hypothetical protein [bacterium]